MINPFESLWLRVFDIDRIPVAIAALVLTCVAGMVTGALAGGAYPLVWRVFDVFLGGFGDKLNNQNRKHADLVARGLFLVLLALILSYVLGRLVQAGAAVFPAFSILEVLCLSMCISSGAVWFALLRLYTALDQKAVKAGTYYTIACTARRNLSASDDFGITRTGLALAARGFAVYCAAPLLWYIIGGLPVVLIYSGVAYVAWRFGKDGFSKGIGDVPLACDKLFGLFPSFFAAILLALAALFTPLAKMHKGVQALTGMKNRAPYEQGGAPVSVMAWALGVSLGGAAQDLSGSAIKSVWVGTDKATAKVDHHHLKYGIFISIMAHILLIAALLGLYIWSSVFIAS